MGKGVNWLAKGQAGWQRRPAVSPRQVDRHAMLEAPPPRPVGATPASPGRPEADNRRPFHPLVALRATGRSKRRPYSRSAAAHAVLPSTPMLSSIRAQAVRAKDRADDRHHSGATRRHPRPLPAVRRPPPRSLWLGGNGRFRCRHQRPRLRRHVRRIRGCPATPTATWASPRRWKRSSAARSTSSPSARSAIRTSGRLSRPPANPSMTSETRQRLLDALSHVAPPRCFSDCQEPVRGLDVGL